MLNSTPYIKGYWLTAVLFTLLFLPGLLFSQPTERQKGTRKYELSNHLGNVLATVTDRKIPVDDNNDEINDWYKGDVFTAQDYYAFGMGMPNKVFETKEYRFGFNGMQLEPSVVTDGNEYFTSYRLYNSKIGRWRSIDPILTSNESTYASFRNNPISIFDPNGDCPECDEECPDCPNMLDEVTVTAEKKTIEIQPNFVDNTSVSNLRQPKSYSNYETTGKLKKILKFPKGIIYSTYIGFHHLDHNYVISDKGKFYPKGSFYGNKYTKISGDLHSSYKSLKFGKNWIYNTAIVVFDATQLLAAVTMHRDQVSSASGTLIMDVSGAVIGYIYPVTGVFFAFYDLGKMSQTSQDKIRFARWNMERIREKFSNNVEVYESDKDYIKYLNMVKENSKPGIYKYNIYKEPTFRKARD